MEMNSTQSTGNYISAFTEGGLTIGAKIFHQPVIVSVSEVLDWSGVSQPMSLDMLQPLIELKPSMILLGIDNLAIETIDQMTSELFAAHHIALEVMPVLSAVRTHNILLADGRDFVSGIVLGSES